MSKAPKVYEVTHINSRGREYKARGTLPELVDYYGYTLEVGASYAHEKGNSKINRNPKTIQSLVSNLEKAKNNAAANGYSGSSFSYREIVPA